MALTVSCMMVAVPAALLLSPLSLAIIVVLIAGLPMTETAPVLVASLTAFLITRGLGLIGKRSGDEEHHQNAPSPAAGASSSGRASAQAEGEG
jgi:hypothetical protein